MKHYTAFIATAAVGGLSFLVLRNFLNSPQKTRPALTAAIFEEIKEVDLNRCAIDSNYRQQVGNVRITTLLLQQNQEKTYKNILQVDNHFFTEEQTSKLDKHFSDLLQAAFASTSESCPCHAKAGIYHRH